MQWCGLPANVFRELEAERAAAIREMLYFCEFKSVTEFMQLLRTTGAYRRVALMCNAYQHLIPFHPLYDDASLEVTTTGCQFVGARRHFQFATS
jgi:hypothetical protein